MNTGAVGRPIRFLGTVIGGWTAARVWLLWPAVTTLPSLLHAVVPAIPASSRSFTINAVTTPSVTTPPGRPELADIFLAERTANSPVEQVTPLLSPASPRDHHGPDSRRVALATSAPTRYGAPVPIDTPDAGHGRSRWYGSSWLLLRGAGPAGVAPGGQLGGAQGGVRLSYALTDTRRLALNARYSAPLAGSGREIGMGLAWQPTRAPVTVLAEARLPLDGGRPAPAISVVGGINPTPIAVGFRLEGYGQAGAVKRDRVEGFADGFLRLARPVTTGAIAVDLGVGTWGGVQPGTARLDLGPSLGVTLPPVAGRRLRVTLDWRERVAGQARPGSGLALALGADF